MGFDTFNVGPELEYFLFRDDKGTETLDEGGYFAMTTLDAASELRQETVRALESMDDPPLLALAGKGHEPREVETRSLGSISDDRVLAHAYAAADVLAVPTLADALAQTAPESMACGTPCVSFDRGGITDVVTHGETGYQARFGDVADLARGLHTILDNAYGFAARCRRAAEEDFSIETQLRRYVGLYESILEKV